MTNITIFHGIASFVKVRGNDCMTVTDGGACIESVADSNNRYYNNFDCDMKVLGAGRLILHRFDTENYYDRLYINPSDIFLILNSRRTRLHPDQKSNNVSIIATINEMCI